jgi:hypothetical protein
MNNIDQIIDSAPGQLRLMLEEARDEIAEAMLQAVNEGKDNDKPAVVTVPFSIKIDLDRNGVTYALTVTRKSKWEVAKPFDDEKQMKLDELSKEAKVEITTSSGLKTGPIPVSVMKKAIEVIKAKQRGDE